MPIKLLTISLLSCLLLSNQVSLAQSDSSSLSVYLAPALYQSFSTTAHYYSGEDNNRLQTLFNEPRRRDQIEQALGGNTFQLVDYAQNLEYNVAFAYAFGARYRWNKGWLFDLQLTNVRLQAVGTFTLQVDRKDPNNNNQQVIEVATASGEESRNHILFALGKQFDLGAGWSLSPLLCFDLNFVEVVNNQVIIAEQTFRLPTFNNILNQQATQITTIGSGYGGALELGYRFPKHYGIALRYQYLNAKIDVNQVITDRGSVNQFSLNLFYRW